MQYRLNSIEEATDVYEMANKIIDHFPPVEKTDLDVKQIELFLTDSNCSVSEGMGLKDAVRLAGLIIIVAKYFSEEERKVFGHNVGLVQGFFDNLTTQGIIDDEMLEELEEYSKRTAAFYYYMSLFKDG